MGNNVKLIRPLYVVEYGDRRELFDDDGYMRLLPIHRLCVNTKKQKRGNHHFPQAYLGMRYYQMQKSLCEEEIINELLSICR